MASYSLEQIRETDKKYYMNTFGDRTPLCFTEGRGIELTDISGTVYKDFFAGIAVSALGHSHPVLVEALKDQASRLLHTSSVYYIENQALLAGKLCDISDFDKAFFASTGAEANEGAIKLARKYFYNKGIDRYEIICLNKSFHGRTITTATATGQEKYKKPYAPLTPGFVHVDINDVEGLKNAVNDHTAAIMIEFIQGESGVHPVTAEFAETIRSICDETGILFIDDEVQTGIGRTGKMFAYQNYGIVPDIMTLAKALGGGVPISAILAKEEVASAFTPGDHGTTFGGNPLSTRAGLAVLEVMEADSLADNAAKVGKFIMSRLKEECSEYIAEVRGMGLMIGVELKEPVAKEVNSKLMSEHHYLAGVVGDSVFRIVPPLIITTEDAEEFIQAFKKSF
ncbi:MAG: aspartate aminotransferase family protein [Clostridia bacterium]|nr:aspartate aminotransferase family protein [Clostridia bacterium]